MPFTLRSPVHIFLLLLFLSCTLLLMNGCAIKGKNQLDKYVSDDEEIIDELYTPRDDGKPLSPDELRAFKTLGQIDRDMPLEDSQTVELHFKYFVHERRGTFQRFLDRTARYLPYMRKVFKERGIPEELVYIAMAESGGNPNAISPAGAAGLWQFMPFTGRRYGLAQNTWIDERRDPFKATYAASDYLLKLYNDFNNWHFAMAAYNAGEGKIGRAIGGTGANTFFDLCRLDEKLDYKARLRDETRNYVPRIIAMAKIMRSLDRLGFTTPSPDTAYNLTPIPVPAGTNLASLSRNVGVTWDEFIGMNPAYRRTASPPTQETTAYLPPDKISPATAWLANTESRSFAGWKEYAVKRKDTFASISKRFKVSQEAIREANGFAKLPKAGTTILIPGGTTQAVEPIYEAKIDKTSTGKSGGKYTVRAGDTLFSLAQKWGTNADTIRSVNKMGKSNSLSIGQRLIIPGNKPVSSIPTAPRPAASSLTQALPQKTPIKSTVSAAGTYTVKAGDTPGGIAQSTGVTLKDLLNANAMTAKSVLRAGQTLKIPSKAGAAEPKAPQQQKTPPAQTANSGTITVGKGDTLFSLAKKYGTSVDALQKANKLTAKTPIKIGQKLRLP